MYLKDFLVREGVSGLENVEIERVDHRVGQMGMGAFTGSIKAIIEAAEKPLVELIKCLQKYVNNYRTHITIPTKNGPIELSHGRSMKAEELKELVTAIQKANT